MDTDVTTGFRIPDYRSEQQQCRDLCNLVEVSGDLGNGASIVRQDRGEGAYGPWRAVNNAVHDNALIHLGNHGQNGIATDEDEDSFWKEPNNQVDRNTYIVADPEAEHWNSINRDAVWQEVTELGLERNGPLIAEQRGLIDFPAVGSLSRRLGSGGRMSPPNRSPVVL
jgi:hypothetical protein